ASSARGEADMVSRAERTAFNEWWWTVDRWLLFSFMTLMFLGMFVAASSGEVLFNRDEADILGHRPVRPQALLRAKVRVLMGVSLWLAAALNLAAFAVGVSAPDGGWRFLPAHAASLLLETLFCVGGVVLTYQLCLRWFGRQRLEGLMTGAQVLVAIAAVIGGQLVPQLMIRYGHQLNLTADRWWITLLPPAWFAGFDDALAGRGGRSSWILAAMGVALTGVVVWLAFERLAGDYETGLQTLSERPAGIRPRMGRRWIRLFTEAPPLRWWLRNPVSKAAFLLTTAYLIRDRDVKLRVYPALAPMLILPVIILMQHRPGEGDSFGPSFIGSYLGVLPLMGVELLEFSQQWQAADVFRAAPIPGPAALCHGARRAVICLFTAPAFVLAALLVLGMTQDPSQLLLLLPGILALPAYAIFPNWRSLTPPLSRPTEEAKAAGRALGTMVVMIGALLIAGLAMWSWKNGWFVWMLVGEGFVVLAAYAAMRDSLSRAHWPNSD
ncbi:MAG: hypothetical protein J0L84_16230, partial [Verrucomicrobia bacterium]|nr:hypothetical protein [Verrucomicrobiota bacterium]